MNTTWSNKVVQTCLIILIIQTLCDDDKNLLFVDQIRCRMYIGEMISCVCTSICILGMVLESTLVVIDVATMQNIKRKKISYLNRNG